MATGINLATLLECSVCMDTYRNPKQLSCAHQYCKECLDRILQFNTDGSATIACPSRCAKRTFIDESEITNDLLIAYALKDILEVFRSSQQHLDAPPSPPTICACTKDVVTYCCGEFRCGRCDSQHQGTRESHEGNVDLVFDKSEGDLKIMCREHMTICTHQCVDNDFLCLYCLHRVHKDHEKYTFEEQVAKVKQALTSDSQRADNLETVLKLSSDNIAEGTKTLDEVLRKRKTFCLSSYLDLLCKEEQRIRDEYKNISEVHKRNFPAAYPKEYYINNLAKTDIQLTVGNNLIVDKLSTSGLRHSSLRHITVALSEEFTFGSAHPLGDLHVTTGEEVLFSDPPTSAFRESFTSEIDNYKTIVAKMIEDLKTLLQESNLINRAISDEIEKLSTSVNDLAEINATAKNTAEPVVKGDVRKRESCSRGSNRNISEKQKRTQTECLKHLNQQGGKYIEELIRRKENNKLELILMAKPDVAKMKMGKYQETAFLLVSETSNLALMKLLVKYETFTDRDSVGSTALHVAALHNSLECAEWLLQCQPTLINVQNKYGWNPLHYAAQSGSLELLQLLLNYGADINMKSNISEIALQVAQHCNKQSCVAELKKWSREHSQQ